MIKMLFRKICLFSLVALVLANILVPARGASIGQSVSVSVSTSSEVKSEEQTVLDSAVSSRSLKSDDSLKNEVEISASYAKKVINNFLNNDKSRSLKESIKTIQKSEEEISTEKPEIEQELTTKFKSESETHEVEIESVKEPVESTSKIDEPVTKDNENIEQEITTQTNDAHVKNEYAAKKIEIDDESSNVKQSPEDTLKDDEPTTITEKNDTKEEATTQQNESHPTTENAVKKIEIVAESRSIDELNQFVSKNDESTNTENVQNTQEVTTQLNDSNENNEFAVKRIEMSVESSSSIESNQNNLLKDEPISTEEIFTSLNDDEPTTMKTTEETTKYSEVSESVSKNNEKSFSEKSNIDIESDLTEAVAESTPSNLESED